MWKGSRFAALAAGAALALSAPAGAPADRWMHATHVLRPDGLDPARDDARREPGTVRAVLHLDPTPRRGQDDVPARPAVADPSARSELPRGRRDQLPRLERLGRG